MFFAGKQRSGLNVPALLCGVKVASCGGQGAEGAAADMVRELTAKQPRQQVKHFQSRKEASNYRHSTPGLREDLKHFTSSASTLERLIASLKQLGVKF